MSGQIYSISKQMRVSFLVIAGLGLAACDDNGKFKMPDFATAADTADATVPISTSTQLVERDVEAPDVFQLTDQGLWDGRPSLGGVWVAHPSATDPERVIIRNARNGKFVIGALFRRERENPGPALQVSSDAADALGLLAGAPTSLNVTALRREDAPVAIASDATADLATPADIAATPLDPVAQSTDITTAAAPKPAPTLAPMPAPTTTQTASLAKPFIQIGIFSIETNARTTADTLRNDGMVATVLAQESQGRSFWRVIVGPAPSVSDRAAILKKVKSLGFADAYFVTN
jgi:cell division septation protein DedD